MATGSIVHRAIVRESTSSVRHAVAVVSSKAREMAHESLRARRRPTSGNGAGVSGRRAFCSIGDKPSADVGDVGVSVRGTAAVDASGYQGARTARPKLDASGDQGARSGRRRAGEPIVAIDSSSSIVPSSCCESC